MIVLAIVIPLLTLAAVVMILAVYKRKEVRGASTRLSRAARRADEAARSESYETSDDPAAPPPLSGREVERAAVLARRTAEEPSAPPADLVPWSPPDDEAVGVSRRQFLNRSVVGFMLVGLSGFGASMLAFLWPPFVTGFGAVVNAGKVEELKSQVRDENGFLKVPEGRMWITEYPESALPKAREVYSPDVLAGMEAGLVALYWKCPHLGCTVPSCISSQWFECPCHGSKYNQVGEKRGGPAPRGMDHFATSVNERGEFLVNTGKIIPGRQVGTDTTRQEAQGPNCIGQAE